MPIFKRCSRCNVRLLSGSSCDCLKQRFKEYDRYSRDKESDTFYHSGEWINTRPIVLDLDKGMDVYLYITTGEVCVANTVHHITPLKDDWNKRIDLNNLISLSSETHSLIERLYKKDKQKIMESLYEILKQYREQSSNLTT